LDYKSEVDLLELLVASVDLLLEELVNCLQDYFIENRVYWIQQNYVLILNTIFNFDNCKKLQDHCLNPILANPRLFITSKDFSTLDKDPLSNLLKRNDLHFQIEEIVIWDNLIKWDIQQIPGLRNIDRRSNKNYEDLKNTLTNFIPLIRFLNISSDDFYDKVRPYEQIIPNKIYEHAMTYYFVEQPKLLNHII